MSEPTIGVSMICYFYSQKIAYWILVSIVGIVITAISYLLFCVIRYKVVDPFNRFSHFMVNVHLSQVAKQTSQRIMKFYLYRFMIIATLIISAIGFIAIIMCIDPTSSTFQQQYILTILQSTILGLL